MNKLVEEAPYHPGYEDAVVSPAQKYKGVDPAKMIWNNNELICQQADRIAELEKQGEPVAWMEYIQDEEWEVWYTEPTDLPEGHSYKPLYLAPQTKPLSDEEIKELIVNKVTDYELCRAIEERHGIK